MTDTNNSPNRDNDKDKLFPEWGLDADHQVVAAGIFVLLAMLALLGWNTLMNDDDETTDEVAAVSDDEPTETTEAEEEDEETTATTEADTDVSTTIAADEGTVQAAVNPLAGDIIGVQDAGVATLTGFVANQGESDEAEAEALAVEGIESVDNQLELIEPAVLETLEAEGVTGPGAAGVGTKVTVSGAIAAEDARAGIIESARQAPGVTGVTDNLEVNAGLVLSDLPQVEFNLGSSVISPNSAGDLDNAAEVLKNAGYPTIEVQGYTDIQGSEAANLALSQSRSDAVMAALIEREVPADTLTAVGYGPTEEFNAEAEDGTEAEQFAANRKVLYEQQ